MLRRSTSAAAVCSSFALELVVNPPPASEIVVVSCKFVSRVVGCVKEVIDEALFSGAKRGSAEEDAAAA